MASRRPVDSTQTASIMSWALDFGLLATDRSIEIRIALVVLSLHSNTVGTIAHTTQKTVKAVRQLIYRGLPPAAIALAPGLTSRGPRICYCLKVLRP